MLWWEELVCDDWRLSFVVVVVGRTRSLRLVRRGVTFVVVLVVVVLVVVGRTHS